MFLYSFGFFFDVFLCFSGFFLCVLASLCIFWLAGWITSWPARCWLNSWIARRLDNWIAGRPDNWPARRPASKGGEFAGGEHDIGRGVIIFNLLCLQKPACLFLDSTLTHGHFKTIDKSKRPKSSSLRLPYRKQYTSRVFLKCMFISIPIARALPQASLEQKKN